MVKPRTNFPPLTRNPALEPTHAAQESDLLTRILARLVSIDEAIKSHENPKSHTLDPDNDHSRFLESLKHALTSNSTVDITYNSHTYSAHINSLVSSPHAIIVTLQVDARSVLSETHSFIDDASASLRELVKVRRILESLVKEKVGI